MNKIIKIEGMHCQHCVASVKQALEKIDGVKEVTVNLETGIAKVELTNNVDNVILKNNIEDIGFDVISVE